jgi:glucose-6-phosphate isomerase
MSEPLTIDAAHLAPDVTTEQVAGWESRLAWAHQTLLQGTGAGADFRGWLDPAAMVPDEQVDEIEEIAKGLRAQSDTLVVIGIGGSYLGARAVVEALRAADAPVVHFAGNSISADYHQRLLDSVKDQRVAVNVVSKSGTTTEPAISFRLFRALVEGQVGKEASKDRIVATTDAKRGALRKVANEVGYRTLPIGDDVGGRYSVLSAVGLLPIAYAGIDIRALRQGAIDCATVAASQDNPLKNPILFYAAARNLLYRSGYNIEVFTSFEPRLHFIAEWWKQLVGESEGKDHISLFPASLDLTTDLHSLGQYMQQGRRQMIETFLILDPAGETHLEVPAGDDSDELGYLAGTGLAEINRAAYQATALAHRDGGVPNQTITLPKLDAYTLGFLLYFFERAIGISGYLMGVNPFDQPGVEAYKKNMFALLAKPGYEKETARLKEAVGKVPAGSLVAFG